MLKKHKEYVTNIIWEDNAPSGLPTKTTVVWFDGEDKNYSDLDELVHQKLENKYGYGVYEFIF